MTDFAMKRALLRTFDRTVCVYRPKSDGTEETVYIDLPCAMSRSAMVSAPSVVEGRGEVAETTYSLSLYTMPECYLRLNDRVVISDATGRSYYGRASDSVRYPSHCVSVVEITEVVLPVVQNGQVSREAVGEALPVAEQASPQRGSGTIGATEWERESLCRDGETEDGQDSRESEESGGDA